MIQQVFYKAFCHKLLFHSTKIPYHYSDVKWASWYLKSPVIQLFVQQIVQSDIKENTKALVTGPLWWESTGDQWMPLTKGQ